MAGPYRTSRLVGDVLYTVMDRELRFNFAHSQSDVAQSCMRIQIAGHQ